MCSLCSVQGAQLYTRIERIVRMNCHIAVSQYRNWHKNRRRRVDVSATVMNSIKRRLYVGFDSVWCCVVLSLVSAWNHFIVYAAALVRLDSHTKSEQIIIWNGCEFGGIPWISFRVLHRSLYATTNESSESSNDLAMVANQVYLEWKRWKFLDFLFLPSPSLNCLCWIECFIFIGDCCCVQWNAKWNHWNQNAHEVWEIVDDPERNVNEKWGQWRSQRVYVQHWLSVSSITTYRINLHSPTPYTYTPTIM